MQLSWTSDMPAHLAPFQRTHDGGRMEFYSLRERGSVVGSLEYTLDKDGSVTPITVFGSYGLGFDRRIFEEAIRTAPGMPDAHRLALAAIFPEMGEMTLELQGFMPKHYGSSAVWPTDSSPEKGMISLLRDVFGTYFGTKRGPGGGSASAR